MWTYVCLRVSERGYTEGVREHTGLWRLLALGANSTGYLCFLLSPGTRVFALKTQNLSARPALLQLPNQEVIIRDNIF